MGVSPARSPQQRALSSEAQKQLLLLVSFQRGERQEGVRGNPSQPQHSFHTSAGRFSDLQLKDCEFGSEVVAMGSVVSSYLDENRRQMITGKPNLPALIRIAAFQSDRCN